MPLDVEAKVIRNTRLSSDYNVIALAAPEIAAAVAPGQFVMVKPGRGNDPLLRRPFSVFEILRANGRVEGLTLLSKRVGVTTRMLLDAVEGDVVSCLGPLGKPYEPVDPPAEAWMVAGGVGLAPFATLTEALRERGTTTTLFYGSRSGRELFYLDWFQTRGVRLVLTTEDGSTGERLRSRADARGGRPHLGEVRTTLAGLGRTGDGVRHGRLLQLRHPRERQDRRPALCTFLHRRARLQRRRSRVGLKMDFRRN